MGKNIGYNFNLGYKMLQLIHLKLTPSLNEISCILQSNSSIFFTVKNFDPLGAYPDGIHLFNSYFLDSSLAVSV